MMKKNQNDVHKNKKKNHSLKGNIKKMKVTDWGKVFTTYVSMDLIYISTGKLKPFSTMRHYYNLSEQLIFKIIDHIKYE